MSKTAERIKEAWERGEKKKVNNTETDSTSVFLFGNEIIERITPSEVHWTMAGWATRTTIDRLNTILGLGLHSREGEVFRRDGRLIDPDQWYSKID